MIPKPAVERLCRIYTCLQEAGKHGTEYIGSGDIEEETGIPAHTVRKDISYLGTPGPGGGKYRVESLKAVIFDSLELGRKPRVCIVGLSPLGLTVLKTAALSGEFDIAAGFDSNTNLIELTETKTDLFPAYMIPDKVKELNIELAVLVVPESDVEKSIERLVKGGIRGILNYTPVPVPPQYGITVRNLYLPEELRILGVETKING